MRSGVRAGGRRADDGGRTTADIDNRQSNIPLLAAARELVSALRSVGLVSTEVQCALWCGHVDHLLDDIESTLAHVVDALMQALA